MKILILEDDIELSLAMKQELLRNDYMVDCCHDGETGLLYALNAEFGYDLAIVDRMLPVIDGLTIIKAMRKKGISVPVIIITGMSSIDDRIDGLDGGADDYLVKPFYIRELLARVRALTRRPHEMKEQDILSYQDLKLERSNRKLEANGKELLLTAKESELLYPAGIHDLGGDARVDDKVLPKALGKRKIVFFAQGTDHRKIGQFRHRVNSFLRKRLKQLNSICEIKTIYGSGYQLRCSLC